MEARYNLGKALLRKGEFDGAMACFPKIAALSPDSLTRWLNLGGVLLQNGNWAEAIVCFRQAIRTNPHSADACANLGVAFAQEGEIKEAIDAWQQALEIQADQADVQNNLAWVLATTPDASLRNGAKAVALAQEASQLNGGGNPIVLHTLAAAYAEIGRYGDAVATARRALELAAAQKNNDLTAKLPIEIRLYEAETPMRDVPR
jgi:tetratricopeptide (TPR) repeat protein